MAEIFNNGQQDPIELESYLGKNGDIIISLDNSKDGPNTFLKLNIFEAQNLAEALNKTVEEFKEELNVA